MDENRLMPEDQDQSFYHLMLGLPEDVTAPDHYVLLGLARFESDPETIHQAAVNRNIQLRAWDNSKYYEIADQITDEVVVAEQLLRDPNRKAEYDARLRWKLGIVRAPPVTDRTTEPAQVTESVKPREDDQRTDEEAVRAKDPNRDFYQRMPLGPETATRQAGTLSQTPAYQLASTPRAAFRQITKDANSPLYRKSKSTSCPSNSTA